MKLFLASLAMLFSATLIGYIILRIELRHEWPSDLPPLPRLLWLGTVLLIVSSMTVQLGLRASRRTSTVRHQATRLWMTLTLALGLGFLAVQSTCWVSLLDAMQGAWAESGRRRFALASFYVLSSVHALHVIGGIIPMSVVTWRLWLGGPVTENDARPLGGVEFCAWYWHFLDVVWIVLFATLLIGT